MNSDEKKSADNGKIIKIAISYRVLDEQDNDITHKDISNEVTTTLRVKQLSKKDYFGLTRTIEDIFNRIGDNVLIRHLFPLNPRKVPKELCGNDPDKFAYFVREYFVGRSKF